MVRWSWDKMMFTCDDMQWALGLLQEPDWVLGVVLLALWTSVWNTSSDQLADLSINVWDPNIAAGTNRSTIVNGTGHCACDQ